MDVGKVGANIQVSQNTGNTLQELKVSKTDTSNSEPREEKREVKVTRKELDSAVDRANSVFFKNNTHLQFKVHKETHAVLVKIVDDETGEVLKEIPPEKFVDMMARITEVTGTGVFVDEKR